MLIGGIRCGVGSASVLTRMVARVPGSYGSGDGALAVVAFGAVPLVQRREDCRLVEVRAPTVLARRSGGQVQLGLRQLRVIDGRGRIRQQRAPSRSHTNGKLRSRSPNDAAASADRGETVRTPVQRTGVRRLPRCRAPGSQGHSHAPGVRSEAHAHSRRDAVAMVVTAGLRLDGRDSSVPSLRRSPILAETVPISGARLATAVAG
jgi:hypothetical protein